MIELIYHKKQKKLVLAQSWEELTTKQYIKIAKAFHAGIDDEDELKQLVLFILSNKTLLGFCMIPKQARANGEEYVMWVLQTQEDITVQLIKKYKGFYGPESNFDNLQLAEFHHTEIAFKALIDDASNLEALNELVAILYREPKKGYDKKRNAEGDIRAPFNFSTVAFYKKKIKRWPLHVKQAIAMWYNSCRQMLVKNYSEAFQGDGISTDDNYYEGLYGMIRNLAGDKYGVFKDVEELNVHAAFLEIVACKHEEEELKRKYPELYGK